MMTYLDAMTLDQIRLFVYVGHIYEEQREPIGRHVWDMIDQGVPYESGKG